MRPRIGVTCAFGYTEERCFLRQAYIRSVLAAGGLPVLLPNVSEEALATAYLDLVDGLLLSGGGDLDPVFFGELPCPALGEISPERDRFEMELIQAALERGIPILGICRGIQVLNVAAGGDIYQDLASQRTGLIMHQQKSPRGYPIHPVKVVPRSRLARALGFKSEPTGDPLAVSNQKQAITNQKNDDPEAGSSSLTVRVNSLHHQAVRKIAPGFTVSAWAPDGVVEAIEYSGETLFLGVQWHPEYLWESHPRFLGLFQALVEAAKK